jgi:hypothetical protein
VAGVYAVLAFAVADIAHGQASISIGASVVEGLATVFAVDAMSTPRQRRVSDVEV